MNAQVRVFLLLEYTFILCSFTLAAFTIDYRAYNRAYVIGELILQ